MDMEAGFWTGLLFRHLQGPTWQIEKKSPEIILTKLLKQKYLAGSQIL